MIQIRQSRVLVGVASMFSLAALVGAGLEAQPSKWTVARGDTSPGGFTLPQEAGAFAGSSIVSEFQVIVEESFLALNDDYAAITSPGDVGLLRLFDQDDEKEWLRLEGGENERSGLFFPATNIPFADREIQVEDEVDLNLRTNGEAMAFVVDQNANNDLDQFQWHFQGLDLSTLRMFLLGNGNLFLDGTYMTFGPELAIRFLREGPTEAGDLVRLAGGRHDRVGKADGAEGEVVVGVVSQRPGLVLGGGILSPQALERAWGAEVAERFRQDLPALNEEILSGQPEMRSADDRLATLDTYLEGRAIKPGREARVRAAYEEALRSHADRLTLQALQTFVDRNFVSVAVGGRARVRVDAAYGAIAPGDLLAASPTAGAAMKARQAGSVLGIALEGRREGQGIIEVLLQRGWYAGEGTDPTRLAASEGDAGRLSALESRVAELAAERGELLERLAAVERAAGLGPRRWASAEGWASP